MSARDDGKEKAASRSFLLTDSLEIVVVVVVV